jgi:hypothetical protein
MCSIFLGINYQVKMAYLSLNNDEMVNGKHIYIWGNYQIKFIVAFCGVLWCYKSSDNIRGVVCFYFYSCPPYYDLTFSADLL